MGTSGTPLNLTEPASGTNNWAATMNANLSAINAAIASLQTQIASLQAGSNTVGPTGAVGMVYAGTWSSSVAYVVNDVVYFSGSSYIAIAPNTNQEPDLYPNTWNVLAKAGAQGPAGPTGPTGATGSGGGTTVSFPITVAEGGTGATAAAAARTNLVAAESGANDDITSLAALTTGAVGGAMPPAVNISSPGVEGQGILLNDNNGHSGGITTSCNAYFESISVGGNISAGGGQFAGGLIVNQPSGTNCTINGNLEIASGGALIIDGPAVAVGSGKVSLGSGTVDPGQALPPTVTGFLVWNSQGTLIRVPFY